MKTEKKALKKENTPVKTEKAITKVNPKLKTSPATRPKARKNVSWDERLNQCKEFRKKNGHCKIPTNYKEDKSLGIWVQEIRRNFKLMMTGKKPRWELTQEQIDELNETEFHWGFTPDPNKFPETDVSWEKNFSKLKKYKQTHGNFDVPMNDKGDSSIWELGKWVRVQRAQKNLRDTKRKCFITKERIKKLDAIGFNWDGPRKINE